MRELSQPENSSNRRGVRQPRQTLTLTDQQLGELRQQVRNLEHRSRSDRQALLLLESELDLVRTTLERFRARVYAVAYSVAGFGALVGWLVEVAK